MTPSPDGNDEARARASQDLVDIAALQKFEAFNRYFLPRLKRKREELRVKFEDDPPDKCGHEEREIRRRILKTYDEIFRVMAEDAKAAQALLAPGR